MPSSKTESQFAGAAAMFRQKESELMEKQASGMMSSPKPSLTFQQRANASMNNIMTSPTPASKGRRSLAVPAFVSPGLRKTEADRPSWGAQKPRSGQAKGIQGIPFSPSPDPGHKNKVNGNSWRGKAAISFQATSPRPLKKAAAPQPFSFPHHGGSYLNTGQKSAKDIAPLPETPDIKIEVKIPDIYNKIRARRASVKPPPAASAKKENVPEHILKYREREAARKEAFYRKQHQSASKLQAAFLGWKARASYPRLRQDNKERLQRIAEETARHRAREKAAIRIQKHFRGFLPKKRYTFLVACKRRREKNQREMKRIEKELAKMPKRTKADIKKIKKDYSDKRKELKRRLRQQMKEEDDKLDEIKKTGHNMIQYIQEENRKLKEQQAATKNEYKVLEKQFGLLTEKSEEIARNFGSLQQYVDKTNASIQKLEISSQKCRHRYLPKYRAEMADRNQHCIAEYRVKALYKARLYRIVKEIMEKSTDSEIIEEAQEALESCESELKHMPEIPVPGALLNRL